MKDFTVVGYFEDSREIFSLKVTAEDEISAFAVVAKKHDDACFVAVLAGHLEEGKGIDFPGSGVVDADTVLSQPDVFGTGELTPFSDLGNVEIVEWMTFARRCAAERDEPIDEEDSPEAEKQAERLYYYLGGQLPTKPMRPIQDIADEMASELNNTTLKLSGKTKEVIVELSALTRCEYGEKVLVPIEFDDSMLELLVDTAYDRSDGEDFVADPEYWERGTCRTLEPC